MQPGGPHKALAESTLRKLQESARQTYQLELDVGELHDSPTDLLSGTSNGEGREPAELLARVYAHAGHRIPVVKRIEKRLEGTDGSSGVGSDLLALIVQLARRNQEATLQLVDIAASQGTAAWKESRAKRKAQRVAKRQARAHKSQTPEG